MALIVEDGSIVSDANSYVTRAAIIAYAGARGVLLADDATTDEIAIKAVDYLELFRDKYIGTEVQPGVQALAWPRTGARIGKTVFPDDAIPRQITAAQLALCLIAAEGVTLIPTTGAGTGGGGGGALTREKIGPLEFEYSTDAAAGEGVLPIMPQVDALLAPLLSAWGGPTRTYRV